jgi:hypothetical protein
MGHDYKLSFCIGGGPSVDLPALIEALDPGCCPAQRAYGKKRGFCHRIRHLAAAGHILVPVFVSFGAA